MLKRASRRHRYRPPDKLLDVLKKMRSYPSKTFCQVRRRRPLQQPIHALLLGPRVRWAVQPLLGGSTGPPSRQPPSSQLPESTPRSPAITPSSRAHVGRRRSMLYLNRSLHQAQLCGCMAVRSPPYSFAVTAAYLSGNSPTGDAMYTEETISPPNDQMPPRRLHLNRLGKSLLSLPASQK